MSRYATPAETRRGCRSPRLLLPFAKFIDLGLQWRLDGNKLTELIQAHSTCSHCGCSNGLFGSMMILLQTRQNSCGRFSPKGTSRSITFFVVFGVILRGSSVLPRHSTEIMRYDAECHQGFGSVANRFGLMSWMLT